MIGCTCVGVAFGSYDRVVSMKMPTGRRKDGWVAIDICLAREIAELWKLGITTTNSCCGHGRLRGSIAVAGGSVQAMRDLGYANLGLKDRDWKMVGDPNKNDNFFYAKSIQTPTIDKDS